MPAKKPDPKIEDIINSILTQSIPQKGMLVNPLTSKPKTRKAATISDLVKNKGEWPIDIKMWTTRTFVDYFAKKYQDVTNMNYKKTYKSDCSVFQNIGNHMVSNGLERNEWTRKFIDWSILRYNEISKREGSFTPNTIFHFVNEFYQDVVLPKVETSEVTRKIGDTSLLEEIQNAEKQGKLTQIFSNFGIPVAMTYLVNVKKFEKEKWLNALEQKLDALKNGGIEEKEILQKIVHTSIIGSPYPAEFISLDWRITFNKYISDFKSCSWWRDNDYKGNPLPKYDALFETEKFEL